MPFYDYRCKECGNEWSGRSNISTRLEKPCPSCGKQSAEIVIKQAPSLAAEVLPKNSDGFNDRLKYLSNTLSGEAKNNVERHVK